MEDTDVEIDLKIYQMVEKAEKYLANSSMMKKLGVANSPMMEMLMRPVLIDIAVGLILGEEVSAKRMGLTQEQLDEIVQIMR